MIVETQHAISEVTVHYPALRIAPPIIAIVLAMVLKDVHFALLLSVFSGCLLLSNFDTMGSVERLCDVIVQQIADTDHGSVILFTVLLGAMISLMNDSGGTTAVITRLANYANSRRKGQILTWLAGIVVFFDDYANTMLVGGSIRPLTDTLKISRAKLAFLIDATAAPIAGLALSTWTAFEIQQVQLGIDEAGVAANATSVFLETIPYRIYPIIAIFFVGAIAVSGKDFGPMLKAERRACVAKPKAPATTAAQQLAGSVWTAVIPICVLIGTVVGLLLREYLSGEADWWKSIDAYKLLLITSLAASTAAVLSALSFGKMTLLQSSESWAKGITSMVPAVIVLVLAWAISDVCSRAELDTAGYIISLIGDSVEAEFLPAIAFITAGVMAVSIGSSFTTMGLMIPMFIPLAIAILSTQNDPGTVQDPVFLATVGAILAGAIFGDHCSPISDTTVLSSAAAGCDHLEHVATQVPYAFIVAVSSLLFGYLPIGFGVPWWIALPLSTAVSVSVVLFFGQSTSCEQSN